MTIPFSANADANSQQDPNVSVHDIVRALFGVGADVMQTPFGGSESMWVVQNGIAKKVNPVVLTIATPNLNWGVGQSPNQQMMFIAPRPCRVITVMCRLEIAEGSAATISVLKASDGSAFSGGDPLLTTGTFDANGAQGSLQILPLASVAVDTLAVGDVVYISSTGVGTNSSGMIQLAIQPLV